jgi:hypothetical protein
MMTERRSCGHEHVAQGCRTEPFWGPVGPPEDQNPVAHGGCSLVETCRCGATRRINANAGSLEVGAWCEVDD